MSNISRRSGRLSLPALITLLITGLLLIYSVVIWITNRKKGQAAISQVIRDSEWVNLYPLILAQSKLETANFTSNVYRNNNNLFGMNVPTKRPFLGERGSPSPEGGIYAKYKNDLTSVRDYVEWLRYTKFPTYSMTPETFVNQMKQRGYFTASESGYLKALKSWI